MSSPYDCLTPFDLRAIEHRQGTEYTAKMMHLVPDAPVVDRVRYVIDQCRGKAVYNLGCASGGLHSDIRTVAKSVFGVDLHAPADFICNIDLHPDYLCQTSPPSDLIVAGEILEHLANPGALLAELRRFRCPVLITVPNALCAGAQYWISRGYEHVNADHVSWFSYRTLKTLVERYGFTVDFFAWYNGKPMTAEGLIFLVK